MRDHWCCCYCYCCMYDVPSVCLWRMCVQVCDPSSEKFKTEVQLQYKLGIWWHSQWEKQRERPTSQKRSRVRKNENVCDWTNMVRGRKHRKEQQRREKRSLGTCWNEMPWSYVLVYTNSMIILWLFSLDIYFHAYSFLQYLRTACTHRESCSHNKQFFPLLRTHTIRRATENATVYCSLSFLFVCVCLCMQSITFDYAMCFLKWQPHPPIRWLSCSPYPYVYIH